jgi:DNA-binding response OmpR family regulator
VFVVDDEVAIGQLIASVLEGEGYAVTVFANGQDALDAIRLGPAPDIALIDLWMAQLGGEEVCRRILALDLEVSCIVMSALNEAATVAERLGLPLLRKPFDIDSLIEIVRATLPRVQRGEGAATG